MIKDLKLTQLEENILKSLISLLYAEAGFSDVDARDIADDIDVDIKVVRGGVGSLAKKGLIDVHVNDSGYRIIYLMNEYWELHPEWSQEVK